MYAAVCRTREERLGRGRQRRDCGYGFLRSLNYLSGSTPTSRIKDIEVTKERKGNEGVFRYPGVTDLLVWNCGG